MTQLTGTLADKAYRVNDGEYAELTTGWNARIRHRPDVVVVAEDTDDVVAAVRHAAAHRMPVRVQATGHGALAPAEGGMLIHTGRWTGVTVDPERRTADVRGGTRWQELLDATQPYALAGLSGSASFVGVVGYALGGGAGWLARRYGLCSDTIEAAEVVTADGRRRWVDADHEPELWWALRGGFGNYGVVTALRLRLVPVAEVYAGARSWPATAAPEVLAAYRERVGELPPEVSSAVTFVQYPDAPPVPEPVRGRTVVQLRAVSCGPYDQAAELLAPLTGIGGALLDTFRVMPYREIGTVTRDPERPMPRTGHSTAVTELAEPVAGAMARLARPEAPFVLLEARHVGGVSTADPGPARCDAEFLVFTMAVTPDEPTRQAAAEFGAELLTAAAPWQTGHKLGTFVLAPPDPAAAPHLVRSSYPAADLARLAQVKATYDPLNLFGGDREITLGHNPGVV